MASTRSSPRPAPGLERMAAWLLVSTVGASAPPAAADHGDRHTWINPGSGQWFQSTNWNPHGIPGASDDAFIHNGGEALVSGGLFARDVYLGRFGFRGEDGHLVVHIVLRARDLYIGDANHGTLRIQPSVPNNPPALYSATVRIGTSSSGFGSGHGEATIRGSHSDWINTGSLYVGDTGNGSLSIETGGRIHSDGSSYVGFDTGTTGAVTLSGFTSTRRPTWTNGGTLHIGYSGTGTVLGESADLISFGSFLGFNGGASGTVTLRGWRATWDTLGGQVFIGRAGEGTLVIQDGATVISGNNGLIGAFGDSEGTVTVTGVQPGLFPIQHSTWIISGFLRVGSFGTGTLTIADGGRVRNTDAYIGNFPDSSGTVTVTGMAPGITPVQPSTWTNTGSVYVGGSPTGPGGTGTLDVLDEGVVWVEDTLRIWNTGTVTLDGGTMTAPTINHTHGGEFNFDGGTLHVDLFQGNLLNSGGTLAPGRSVGTTTITGHYTQQPGAELAIEIGGGPNCSQADRLTVAGSAALAGALNIALIDGCQPQPGQRFDVVFYGSRSGEFAPVHGMGLGGGLRLLPVYGPDRLSLEAVPTVGPDLDGDGDVDEQDLALLAACATGPAVPYDPQNLPPGCMLEPDAEGIIAADFDRDGDVDHDDFAILQRCYGGPGNPPDLDCVD